MGRMAITASKLRENIYRILDGVIETGEPVEIDRGGRRLRIVVVESDAGTKAGSRFDRLVLRPDLITGDPDQTDLLPGMSGLMDIAKRLETVSDAEIVRLGPQDVVRHPLVACMLAVL